MAGEDRHEMFEAARARAELTVPELWLRYVALGGDGDLFDVDGYLAGLLPLSTLDQNVLAVAINERLDDLYRDTRVPLSTEFPDHARRAELDDVIAELLASDRSRRPERRAAPGDPPQPPGPQPSGEPGVR